MLNRNPVILLVLLGGTGGLLAISPTAQSELSLPQLRDSVSMLRGSITDFSVEFTFEAVQAASNSIATDHRSVAVKDGEKFRMERWYSGFAPLDGSGDAPSWFVAATYDGVNGCGYQQVNRIAYLRTGGDIPLIDTEGSGFFDLLRYYPCAAARGEGIHARDLLSVLDSNDTSIRPNLEEVDGHACYVVDAGELPDGQPKETIWIDPERGYLPVLQQVFVRMQDGSAALLLELRIDEAVELGGGVWLPVQGARRTFGLGSNADTIVATEYEMHVARNDDGSPVISVNAGLPDSYFDYSMSLPPGTTIANLETGEQWTVSNADYAFGADTALASAGVSKFPSVASQGSGWLGSLLGQSAPWKRTPWIVIAACSISVGLVLAVRQLR